MRTTLIRSFAWHFCLVLASLLSCVLSSSAAAETRLALLIGNQDYPSEVGRLSRPHDDVRILGDALRTTGFEIDIQKDLDRAAFDEALDRFETRIIDAKARDEEVVAFFYYSGHGASAYDEGRRRNFMLPAKRRILNASQLVRYSVPLDVVIRGLAATGADTVFIVSDACRNELQPGFSRGDKGWEAVNARRGMLIASATYPGETAPDDGAFAEALAAEIRQPGKRALLAFSDALRKVAAQRGDLRLPTLAPALARPFFFNGQHGETPPQAPPSIGNPNDNTICDQAWERAKRTDDCLAYRAFLRACFESRWTALAEESLTRRDCSKPANPIKRAPAPELDAKALARAAQTELNRLGFYYGPIDGIWGKGSINALRSLSIIYGYDAIPVVNNELIERLRTESRQSTNRITAPGSPKESEPIRFAPTPNWQQYFQDVSNGAILINLTDRWLIYFSPSGTAYTAFPIATPRDDTLERFGITSIVSKRRRPTWHPTSEAKALDSNLPESVPPGSKNPMGDFALDLAWHGHSISGIDDEKNIGTRSTLGTIALREPDAEWLFNKAQINTPVFITPGVTF